jgi:rod shape-determining protein MreD
MKFTIAAALAVVTALIEFTVVPYLKIGDDAVPHPVLVFGVITAIVGGLEVGLTWAFVGGLALDIVTQRPLGSTSFALLIAVGVGYLVGSFLGRIRILAPIGATAVASPLYSMLIILTNTALTTAPLSSAAIASILPSTVYDVILAAVVGPLAVAIAARRRDVERAAW